MQFRLKGKNGNSVLMSEEEVGKTVLWQFVFWLFSLISYVIVPFALAVSLLPSWESSESECIFKGLLACVVSILLVFFGRRLNILIVMKIYAALGSIVLCSSIWSLGSKGILFEEGDLASFLLGINLGNFFHAAVKLPANPAGHLGALMVIFFLAFVSYRFAAFTNATYLADEL